MEKQGDIRLHLTVDKGEDGWRGHVGFVPDVTRSVAPNPKNAYAMVCGPTGHDPVHTSCAEGTRFRGRTDLSLPGNADEVRHREVRSVQFGEQVHLQRRPGVFTERAQGLTVEPISRCLNRRMSNKEYRMSKGLLHHSAVPCSLFDIRFFIG